jgi:hypothetical protein
MTHVLKTALLSATLLMSAAAYAQTPRSAFGHWEGMINSPLGSAVFEIDLGPGANAVPIAALSIPDENIASLPLRNVKVEGSSVSFELPGGDAGKFSGTLAEDGRTLSGMLDKPFGSAEFSLSRNGEARFAAEPVNAAIDKRFQGEWSGPLNLNGRAASVRITLSNPPGKGAVGRMILDGEVAFPLGVVQAGKKLTLDIVSAKESVTAELDDNGDLVGEYIASSGARAPLSLKRTAS